MKRSWLAIAVCLLPQLTLADEPPDIGWQERAAITSVRMFITN